MLLCMIRAKLHDSEIGKCEMAAQCW